MTGSLQIKNRKYYAVINYKNSEGKRKQKMDKYSVRGKGEQEKG